MFKGINRRQVLAIATGLATSLLLGQPALAADDYPNKPITLIVPFAPGGGASQGAQVIANGLEKILGQTVIVDNRPGGATVVGTAAAARAAPDGYTLLLGSSATSVNEGLIARKPYNALTDLTPIATTVDAPYVLLANNNAGINNVQELIAKAKAQPNTLRYGSAGIGSSHQLFMLYLMSLTGTQMRHIPYEGGNPAATAVASGEVAITFADAGAVQEMVKGGLLKAIAVSPGKRMEIFPEVPTIQESGVPGFDLTTWQAIMGPAGMNPAVVKKLNEAVNKVLADPELQKSLARTGKAAMSGTTDEFKAYFAADVERWKKVIAAAGIGGK
ncbi:MAG: tripartite tricarboxylate transporter substrate binding protein [Alphaproteobacteria bacterium]|nr:tripartite tricarboxylate transporter substrate binding protein [Alphaproteobacteria bacterium]